MVNDTYTIVESSWRKGDLIMLRLILLAALLLLTSCGILAQTPPDKVVKLAIAQTLTNTQQTLAKDLSLNAPKPNFKLKKFTVKSREKVNDPAFKQYPGEVYRVRGTFDATLASSAQTSSQADNPFDLYLNTDTQETDEVETWFLIEPR